MRLPRLLQGHWRGGRRAPLALLLCGVGAVAVTTGNCRLGGTGTVEPDVLAPRFLLDYGFVCLPGASSCTQTSPPIPVDSGVAGKRSLVSDTLTFDRTATSYRQASVFQFDSAGMRRTQLVVLGPRTYTIPAGATSAVTLPAVTFFPGAVTFSFLTPMTPQGSIFQPTLRIFYQAR